MDFTIAAGLAVNNDPWTFRKKGLGLLSQFLPAFSRSFRVKILITYAMDCHVHIWQMSPQLCCGDIFQIWMWFKYSNMSKILNGSKISLADKSTNGSLETPTQACSIFLCTMNITIVICNGKQQYLQGCASYMHMYVLHGPKWHGIVSSNKNNNIKHVSARQLPKKIPCRAFKAELWRIHWGYLSIMSPWWSLLWFLSECHVFKSGDYHS